MADPKPSSEGSEPQNEKWYERTRYQVLLFAGGIVLFVLVGGWILDWYVEPKTSGEKKDLIQALGLITAGVAGAVGIYFTWRGQRLAREAQEHNQRNTQEQLRNAQEQLRLSRESQEANQRNTQEQLEQSRNELAIHREGQITDRFTRAIDQLGATDEKGNKLFEIRLGGIYALERIARESEEDYWPIMEVLTAYARHHAPWSPKDTAAERKSEEPSGESGPVSVPTAPDIQAIMTVLRRRPGHYGHGEPESLDLHETKLSGANLREANLREANLSGANLSGANFRKADLREAGLQSAHLSGADLSRMSGAALMVGAILIGANLSGANLSGANLSGAILSNAKGLIQEQIEEAFVDESTKLPSNLNPSAHWGVKTNEQIEDD